MYNKVMQQNILCNETREVEKQISLIFIMYITFDRFTFSRENV